MIIKKKTTSVGGIVPDAKIILNMNFDQPLYYQEQNKKHPRAIYQASLSGVAQCTLEVIERLQDAEQYRTFETWGQAPLDSLLEAQKALLYQLEEHLDDCKSIIQCFFPHKDACGPQLKILKERTKAYDQHMGRIVSQIKHHQAKLRAIIYYDEDFFFPGYFVEGLDSEGALGPNPLIHPPGTAFSFARDLRYHLFHVYYISKVLSEIIVESSNPKIDVNAAVNCDSAEKIIRKIQNYRPYFYQDEIKKPNPFVQLKPDTSGGLRLTLSYGSKDAPKPKSIGDAKRVLKQVITYVGDGISRKFKLLYE